MEFFCEIFLVEFVAVSMPTMHTHILQLVIKRGASA